MAPEVVITNAVRTPIGRLGGVLRDSTAVELGAHAMRALMERSGIDPQEVDEVVVGHARQAGNGPNPGRLMAVRAGLPVQAPAHTVQQACLSSMKALMLAAQSIALGDSHVVVVGGSEHMSGIPYLAPDVRWGKRMGDGRLVDGLSKDGFIDPLTGKHMGELAEAWSLRFDVDREDQDWFALASQQKAAKAQASGFAERTIAPVSVSGKKGDVLRVDTDEHPRPDSSLERLAKLPSAFAKGGTVTAGNASGITDGAVALLVMSAERAETLGLEPLAFLRSWSVRAAEPADYGLAVAPASTAALQRAGVGAEQMDVIEMNEAFAIQVLAACALLRIEPDRVNPYGGAIALGHPVGMSGARIVQYAAEALAEDGGRYALATICGNGGHGGAVVLERA